MLHSLAKSEMRRQEIRKQLQETDQEVMEWLRVFSVSFFERRLIYTLQWQKLLALQ